MTKIDLSFGGTFCVLPWIEKFKTLQGNEQFCCWSKIKINDSDTNLLRQKIWNNQKIEHCQSCYTIEQKNIISPRQKETIFWLKDNELKKHFNTDNCPPFKPLFLDLRTSNKCNLACISCNPIESSLWAKELGIKIVPNVKPFDFQSVLSYKKIYLAGGEPLIINEYLDLINFIAENNPEIELVINTNLTRLPSGILKSIKKLKKISFIVSVDSYEKVNEYHRFPLQWSKFMNNLNQLMNYGVFIQFNTVIDAISIFGLGKLNNISHFPNQWNLTILTEPNWLLLKNIPVQYKNLAIDNLHMFKSNRFYGTDIIFKNKIDQLYAEINKEGNSMLLLNEIKLLDLRRKINHKDYLGFSLF